MIIGTTIAANKAKNNRRSGVGNNSVNNNEIKAKPKGKLMGNKISMHLKSLRN